MLEKIQRRVTKLIPGLRDLSYEERLWTDNTRNVKIKGGSNRSVLKILNGYENIYSNIFFRN